MIVCFNTRGSGCGYANLSHASFCTQCGNSLKQALVVRDPGDIVDQWCITRMLGFGSYGVVYQAEHRVYSQTVALKEAFDAVNVTSFQNEFAVLQHTDHPNLPKYLDMFEAESSGFLVMEYVPGQSLDEVLARHNRPLLESQVLGYAFQLCDALIYLHELTPPILHRDIKPANVRLTPEGLIKLVDFGLFKQGIQATAATRRGLTPAYAPIEQWSSTGGTDARSDLYSLGATLFHCLTNSEPPTVMDRLSEPETEKLLKIEDKNSRTSPHVREAITTVLNIKADHRYDSAARFKRALQGDSTQTSRATQVDTAAQGVSPEPPRVVYSSATIQMPTSTWQQPDISQSAPSHSVPRRGPSEEPPIPPMPGTPTPVASSIPVGNVAPGVGQFAHHEPAAHPKAPKVTYSAEAAPPYSTTGASAPNAPHIPAGGSMPNPKERVRSHASTAWQSHKVNQAAVSSPSVAPNKRISTILPGITPTLLVLAVSAVFISLVGFIIPILFAPAWIMSCVVGALLSHRKGYTWWPGLTGGAVLGALGVAFWLVTPPVVNRQREYQSYDRTRTRMLIASVGVSLLLVVVNPLFIVLCWPFSAIISEYVVVSKRHTLLYGFLLGLFLGPLGALIAALLPPIPSARSVVYPMR